MPGPVVVDGPELLELLAALGLVLLLFHLGLEFDLEDFLANAPRLLTNRETPMILGVIVEDVFLALYLALLAPFLGESSSAAEVAGRIGAAFLFLAVLFAVARYRAPYVSRVLGNAEDEILTISFLGAVVLVGGVRRGSRCIRRDRRLPGRPGHRGHELPGTHRAARPPAAGRLRRRLLLLLRPLPRPGDVRCRRWSRACRRGPDGPRGARVVGRCRRPTPRCVAAHRRLPRRAVSGSAAPIHGVPPLVAGTARGGRHLERRGATAPGCE